jgi:hypothetical protein
MSVRFAEANDPKPSIQELATFANRTKDIHIGGGSDELIEIGDDLGTNLLANQNKFSASPKAQPNRVSVNTSSDGNAGIPVIQLKPVDDLDVINLETAPGTADISIHRPEPAPFIIHTGGDAQASVVNHEEEAREKQNLLNKIRRLDSGSRMTQHNSLSDIRSEYDKLTDSRNLEASIRFQRNALMTFVTGVEMVNEKIGHRLPLKPRLKGWSESVHTNVEDFDEIFEEMYDLYKDKAKMHPLLRLAGTLGVSATMYHLTNTMAEKSGIPEMTELLHENPELRQQFAQAAAAKLGGLGNFMNAAAGPSLPPSQKFSAPPSASMNTRGVPFHMSSAAAAAPAAPPSEENPPRVRREMKGPSGVDDILRAFEAEKQQQQNAPPPQVRPEHVRIFSPAGLGPGSPNNVHRSNVGTLGDPLHDFTAGSEDTGSIGSGNTERRRGRRRAEPVGTTLNLNV